MQCAPASLSRATEEYPARLSLCSSSKCISFSRSFDFILALTFCDFACKVRSARYILYIPSVGLGLPMRREPPDFDGHVRRHPARPRRRRNPASYRISTFGSRNVNDPVAQQKLLRFGENAVCDRHAVFLPAHNLGFTRFGQALCGHKLSGFGQVLIDALEDRHMRFNVLLRPGVIGVNTCL